MQCGYGLIFWRSSTGTQEREKREQEVKITTRITWDMNTGEVLEHEYFDYEGPLALCGSGPSALQRQQAEESARLNRQLVDLGNKYDQREQSAYDAIAPFAKNRLATGLPYRDLLLDSQHGLNARTFQPLYADLNRRWGNREGLPSGAYEAMRRGIQLEEQRAFDAGLRGALAADDAAKIQGAELLRGQQVLSSPMQAYGQANDGFRGIYDSRVLMNSNPMAGILGGLFGGVGQAFVGKLPFGGNKGPNS